jgi:hypothetical protein
MSGRYATPAATSKPRSSRMQAARIKKLVQYYLSLNSERGQKEDHDINFVDFP